ncbi:MAG TPA: glutamate 5-kinase, partial [Gammaproteobacteria bacterium]|nr:glutamate 5-kinase [Gammaproteobacteria bacterium]
RSGASTLIASGREPRVLEVLHRGENMGTLLKATDAPVTARKQWLAGHLQTRGRLVLDAGAIKVLQESGRSLLAVGVTAVEGDFSRGDMVVCVDSQGREVARGLVNYPAADVRKMMGQASDKIETLLGYVDEAELIHRDNLVLVG